MAIVPRQPDAIAQMLAQANRMSVLEAGCAGGGTGDPLDPVGDMGEPPVGKTNLERDIIAKDVARKRASGTLVYPSGGAFPPIGPAKLRGFGVTAGGVADRVGIAAQFRFPTRSGMRFETAGVGVLFQLPPGWGPGVRTVFSCPTNVAGQNLDVVVDIGGAVFVIIPQPEPGWAAGLKSVDLNAIAFDAGGGACPGGGADSLGGFPARDNDVTWAGDGRQWDVCPGGSEGDVTPDDPEAPPGGGSGPVVWTDFVLGVNWINNNAALFGNARYAKDASGFVHLTGDVRFTGGGPATVMAVLPVGFRPNVRVVFPGMQGSGAVVSIAVDANGDVVCGGNVATHFSLAACIIPTN